MFRRKNEKCSENEERKTRWRVIEGEGLLEETLDTRGLRKRLKWKYNGDGDMQERKYTCDVYWQRDL